MSEPAGPPPEALLLQAQAGDAEALGTTLEQYRNYLSVLVRLNLGRRLQGKLDASDLVQETFLRAHQHFAQFRGATEREFVNWLRQILAAHLAEVVRRYFGARCRDVRLEERLALDVEQASRVLERGLVGPQSSPSQQVVRRELAVVVSNALAELPTAYREVLLLHHLEDLSFPEVARRMGRSVDSVKNVWVRALTRLRRSLGAGS